MKTKVRLKELQNKAVELLHETAKNNKKLVSLDVDEWYKQLEGDLGCESGELKKLGIKLSVDSISYRYNSDKECLNRMRWDDILLIFIEAVTVAYVSTFTVDATV